MEEEEEEVLLLRGGGRAVEHALGGLWTCITRTIITDEYQR